MKFYKKGGTSKLYLLNNKIIKFFNKKDIKLAEREFNTLNKVYKDGLPVPRVYDIIKYNNNYGVLMEFIKGNTLRDDIKLNPERSKEYILKLIKLQIKINSINANGFSSLKEYYKEKIFKNKFLSEEIIQKLLQNFETVDDLNNLCHNDITVDNIIVYKNKYKIIDWYTSSRGNFLIDVCKTYFLLKQNCSIDLGNFFIDNYCNINNIQKNSILFCEQFVYAMFYNSEIREKTNKKELIEMNKVINKYVNIN